MKAFKTDVTCFMELRTNHNLGELRWNAGCRFSGDRSAGTLTILRYRFPYMVILAKFGGTRDRRFLLVVDLRLHRFDKNDPDLDDPLRSLVRVSM